MFDFHISRLPQHVPALYVPPPKSVVACIGSPKKIPECMAPLAGSLFWAAGMDVIGTIHEPVLSEAHLEAVLSKRGWEKNKRLVIEAAVSDLQPGFAELGADFNEGVWRLRVHLPKTAHYPEVVRFARQTFQAVRALMRSHRHAAV